MTKIRAYTIFIAVIILAFSGCTTTPPENGDSYPKETIPGYINSEEKTFSIGMWSGIPVMRTILDGDTVVGTRSWTNEEFLEQYQMIKDAGFTIAANPGGIIPMEHNLRMLDAAEEVGVMQLIWDAELNNILLDKLISDEDAVAAARRKIVDYMEHSAFFGNAITDEPQVREYEALGRGQARYSQLLPDKLYFINLFPIYATRTQLGGASYSEYLSRYAEEVSGDLICYDYYPLDKGAGTVSKMRDSFLYNMEMANDAVKPTGGQTWTIIQSMGFGNMMDPSTIEEFRLQAYASLSYGITGIKWFCYYSPLYGGAESFTPAIITLDGQKTAKYDLVKTVNNEILSFDDIYLNFDYMRTMAFDGSQSASKNGAFEYLTYTNTHERISSFTSTRDIIAGVFKDAEGRDGFMLTNYDDLASTAKNAVSINFKGATKVIYYLNGQKYEADIADGKFDIELDVADGLFIIPLNI